ncbi:hypothetical protein BRADI_1g54983v3 [Brachypodium distachyon]|uniref:Uncharacterized protein n=1 Tax=Brachypodium distachyon TaxID=15368 RepID=A0A2K2DRG2_BRADI|nr:hypothetical protein BRADI_1g54983v3 [Brachypodium distachyon]PNT76870.1 hypothetical protein BRADI_1g54983v3 [Brachypodium distachyon]
MGQRLQRGTGMRKEEMGKKASLWKCMSARGGAELRQRRFSQTFSDFSFTPKFTNRRASLGQQLLLLKKELLSSKESLLFLHKIISDVTIILSYFGIIKENMCQSSYADCPDPG